MNSKRPEDWTAEKKLKAIVEYENLDEEQRGKYLREKGLHSVHLERWQQEFVEAYASRKKKTKGGDPRQKRIKELEGDLRRKDKALAETAALLVLKKKPRRFGGTQRTRDKPGGSQDVYRVGWRSGRSRSSAMEGV